MTGLVDGSAIVLRTRLNNANAQELWLDKLDDQRLTVVSNARTDSKSQYWKVHQVGDDLYQFENLGASNSGQTLWLKADLNRSSVRLSPDRGDSTSGTYWQVSQDYYDEMSYIIKPLGSSSARSLYLGWTTALSPSVLLTTAGLRWRAFCVPEPGVGLQAGEIELRTTEGVARLLTQDTANLAALCAMTDFTQLRVGPETGVTIFAEANFQGQSQPLLAGTTNLKSTRLTVAPKSIKVWSTTDKPYTGKWAIKAPNGQYLSQGQDVITTMPNVGATELFVINRDQPQVKLIGKREAFSTDLPASNGKTLTWVDETDRNQRKFSLKVGSDRWISLQAVDKTISLRAANGQYVCAESGGGSTVVANRSAIGRWEKLELIKVAGNKVALKVFNGQYVCAEGGGGGTVVANQSAIDRWESFEMVQLGDNKVALKAFNGQYVSAATGGGGAVVASSNGIGPWETFELSWAGKFGVSDRAADRAIFTCAIKLADNETQVGEVLPGEIALYEHVSYWGKAWIFYGDVGRFTDTAGLNDQVSSIVLGKQTGATLYRDEIYGTKAIATIRKNQLNLNTVSSVVDPVAEAVEKYKTQSIEDVVEAVPSLLTSQIGNDTLSSLRVWRNLPPSQVGISFSCCLSQDYKLNSNDTLQEFSSYRTILQLPAEITSVDVWATDLITITVDDKVYTIDEDRSVRLSPNAMQRLMITSTAEGINTPGLKLRTNTMAAHERIVIFPDKYAHGKLAALPKDALWNAKDNAGNSLIDRNQFDQTTVTAVQTSIQNTLSTVEYVRNDSDNYAVDRKVIAEKLKQPWKLTVNRYPGQIGTPRSGVSEPTASAMETLSQEDFAKLVATANSQGGTLAQGWSSFTKKLKSAVKSATSVVVGVVEDVVHVVTSVADTVTTWVVDTAEKVGAFIEGVIEKIGVAIEKFIEYLRFLFNWGDILTTQRALVEVLNTIFDYTARTAASNKEPVQRFLTDQRETIRNSINQQIEKFGGDTTTQIEGKTDQPEALEWLMAKLNSGSKDLSPNLGFENVQVSDQLLQAFKQFLQDFEAVETTFVSGFVNMGGAIEQMITNPGQPQVLLVPLLTLLRDLLDQALNILQNLISNVLDCATDIIQKLRQGLNFELNIPFVTTLFRQISGGQPLTLLNLNTLLLAIPVTILSKLMFNRAPFQNASKLALSNPNTDWPITGIVVDGVNTFCTAILDAVPEDKEFKAFGTLLEISSLLANFVKFGIVVYDANHVDRIDQSNTAESLLKALLAYQATVLMVDVTVTVLSGARLKKPFDELFKQVSGTFKNQRLRRINGKTMIASTVLSVVDLALTSTYLGFANISPISTSAKVISGIPGILVCLRHPTLTKSWTTAPLALSAVDMVCLGYAFGVDIAAVA